MRYNANTMPDAVRKLLPLEAKKELGAAGLCMTELIERQMIRSEKALQRQVADYLRLRQIPFILHRTDKKTTCGVGVEDFACCAPGGVYLALECKWGDGELSPEQIERGSIVEAVEGIYEVVRSLADVKAILDRIKAENEDQP